MSYKLYLLSYVRLVSRGQFFVFFLTCCCSLSRFKEEKSDDGRRRNENVSQSSSRYKQMARCLVVHNSHAVAACLHPNNKLQHTFSRHTLLFRYFSTFHLAFLHVLNFQFTFCYRGGDAVIHNYVAEEFFCEDEDYGGVRQSLQCITFLPWDKAWASFKVFSWSFVRILKYKIGACSEFSVVMLGSSACHK